MGGCCFFCSFSFFFFGFDEIVQPLSSCQSDNGEEQAEQEEAWRNGGGKGREEREGKGRGRGVFVSLKTSDF